MNKKEIIRDFAQRYDLKVYQAEELMENIIQYVADVLVSGDEIKINGFCTIRTKLRKGKLYRKAKTGELTVGKDKILIKTSFARNILEMLNSRM